MVETANHSMNEEVEYRLIVRDPQWSRIDQMKIEPQFRFMVRILLVDELDRILFYKRQDPANLSDVFWCPIGLV